MNIDASNCVVTGVTNSATRMRRALTASGVDIAYDITYDVVALGFAGNAATAYTTLVSSLTAAVTGGSFTEALQSYAVATGNTDLAEVSSSAVAAEEYVQVTSEPTIAPTVAPFHPTMAPSASQRYQFTVVQVCFYSFT